MALVGATLRGRPPHAEGGRKIVGTGDHAGSPLHSMIQGLSELLTTKTVLVLFRSQSGTQRKISRPTSIRP